MDQDDIQANFRIVPPFTDAANAGPWLEEFSRRIVVSQQGENERQTGLLDLLTFDHEGIHEGLVVLADFVLGALQEGFRLL